ncbi:hypothetical protein ACIRU8_42855 [Streptomyces sp. NPDC101175]|uniref:hypothetical protein n=1 Tax=Streptomyces sp. NPDC101175 TaxID=3366123 RepID=UPI003832DF0D
MTTGSGSGHGDGDDLGVFVVAGVLAPILSVTAGTVFMATGFGLHLMTPTPRIAQPMITAAWVFYAITGVGVVIGTVAIGIRTIYPRYRGQLLDSGLTGLAVYLAGHRRAHLGREWCAHLAGEYGIPLSRWHRFRLAAGFVAAALVMRCGDVMAVVFWGPLRWILRTDRRADTLISSLSGILTVCLTAFDGLHAVITQDSGGIALVVAALCGAKRWLRRVLEIDVTEPPNRRQPPDPSQ